MDGLIGGFFTLRIHIKIDIRSERVSDSPMRHGQIRIHIGGTLKRTNGFVMVKSVNHGEALIEKLLRLRIFCGNRMMVISYARQQLRSLSFFRATVLVLRKTNTAEENKYEDTKAQMF